MKTSGSRTRTPCAALLALWLAGAMFPMPAAGQEAVVDALRKLEAATELASAPVQVDGNELFRVRGVSSLHADERAAAIGARIEALAGNPSFKSGSLRVEESGGYVSIMAGTQRIMVVADWDAQYEQASRHALARAYLERLRDAIDAYRAERTHQSLTLAAIRAAAATAVLAVALAILFGIGRRIEDYLRRKLEGRIGALDARTFEILRADRVRAAFGAFFRALLVVAGFAAVFVYLSFVMRSFPWLRGTGNRLVELVAGPLGTMGRDVEAAIPGLLVLAILYFITRFALRLARIFFDAVASGSVTLSQFEREWAHPTYKIVRFFVIVAAVIAGFPYIPGSSSDAFKAITVFIGILLSLGSSSAVANIIAGFMMTYRRTFKVGDRVKVGDTVGFVTDVRLQTTNIRSLKNEEVVLPNSLILNTQVTNFSSLAAERGLILHTPVSVGFEVPWRQVEAMLCTAAGRTRGIEPTPPPYILYQPLGPFAINYELNARTRDVPRMSEIQADLHRNILDVFNEYGVQIMTPVYDGDPEQPKVVPRERWHVPPAPADSP